LDWLNYHHLYYFWIAVREGSIARAATRLRLSHPTVGEQLRTLEDTLGEKLLVRGRTLGLTEAGALVFSYAEEIFPLGRELLDTLKGRPTGRPLRLVVGIAESLPKLVAKRLLDPARTGRELQLTCRQDKTTRLITQLAAHELDVVLTDQPVPAGSGVRAFNHLLGECGVSVFGRADLAARYRPGFPHSLDGAPLLVPTEDTHLRRALDAWLEAHRLRPDQRGQFDDSALIKAFGHDGVGLFVAPSVIADDICRQYTVEVVAHLPEVRERFYALTLDRRMRHPAVVDLCQSARSSLFAPVAP
jgi:LysR family transcriptional regulator, transcriptional activator of nhaA